MGVKVFDMGKNARAAKYVPVLQAFLDSRPDIEAYVRGRTDQFMLDLLMTGKAMMPDGQVGSLFPETDHASQSESR